MFQSTHPRGVRRNPSCTSSRRSAFQSTHPRGVRPGLSAATGEPWCFNPRTRVGCDQSIRHILHTYNNVSIHAPAWGATSTAFLSLLKNNCFNPRTRVGCDPDNARQRYLTPEVSIHAPAWGATAQFLGQQRIGNVSIHAPAWGATLGFGAPGCPPGVFQSTHPRGVRRDLKHRAPPPSGFNPRTRVGCDAWLVWAKDNGYRTFQSTHPRGVRLRKS